MRNLSFFLATLVSTLLIGLQCAQAQEVTETSDVGWPIEVRCVGEPTKPPKGWSYDGTIFLETIDTAHAVSYIRPESYYVAYDSHQFGALGSLSPDGKIFAVPVGEVIPYSALSSNNNDTLYSISELRFYETKLSQKFTSLRWSLAQNASDALGIYILPRIVWLDNSHILYSTNWIVGEIEELFVIDIITGERSAWNGNTQPKVYPFLGALSPDKTRFVGETAEAKGIYETSGNLIASLPLYDYDHIAWTKNSGHFAALTQDGLSAVSINIFDRDGHLESTIYKLTPEEYLVGTDDPWFHKRNQNLLYSPDGSQIAFTIGNKTGSKLLIADTKSQRLYDLCINLSDGLAWSSNGKQLAITVAKMLRLNYEDKKIILIDMMDYQSYLISYHEGTVFDWRAD